MLRKNHKIKRADFEVVFKKGKIIHSPFFAVRLLEVDSWNEVAFSVVVSKKIARLATARNRNKRKVYSALKTAFKDISKSYMGVIVLKKDLSNTPSKEISKELSKILK